MKKLDQLVNPQLTTSIKNYDRLSDFVYQLLHLNKDKHNLWVVTKRNKLTILTDNPYLGTQIRYQQQTICTEINKQFLMELKDTHVKIIPPSIQFEDKKGSIFKISEKTANVLTNIASQIEDVELKESLLNLANKK